MTCRFVLDDSLEPFREFQMSTLRITWIKSGVGYARDQRRTLRALGLRRLHQTVEREDSPSTRGMVFKVKHLVEVEEGSNGEPG